MEDKQINDVVKVRITELEDRLMDIIEIANQYPEVPVPIFEENINLIIKEIDFLQRLL